MHFGDAWELLFFRRIASSQFSSSLVLALPQFQASIGPSQSARRHSHTSATFHKRLIPQLFRLDLAKQFTSAYTGML
jgi:hypothetical protein